MSKVKIDVLDFQQKLLEFAFLAQHMADARFGESVLYGGSAQGESSLRRVTFWADVPANVSKLTTLAKQMQLFDWLCSRIAEDDELLDHFATRLMEKLLDRELERAKR